MATPCLITKIAPDGTCTVCTCRSDGFLTGVGAHLIKYYQNEAKIDRLIAQFMFSPIEAEPEDVCVTFEEGEETPSGAFSDLVTAMNKFEWGFAEVFTWTDGRWHIAWTRYHDDGTYTLRKLVPISRAMVVKRQPDLDAWFDSTEREATFMERWQSDQDRLVEYAKTHPNIHVFGDPAHGVTGVMVSSDGFPNTPGPLDANGD